MAAHYLTKRLVVVINRMCTGMTGGYSASATNMRPGASLGFVERVFYNDLFGQPLYPDLYHQAAAYMFHVIKDHVFSDGNKRTGLACAVTFLQMNDVAFAPFDEDRVFDFVVSVAAGPNDASSEIPRIAAWFRDMSLS